MTINLGPRNCLMLSGVNFGKSLQNDLALKHQLVMARSLALVNNCDLRVKINFKCQKFVTESTKAFIGRINALNDNIRSVANEKISLEKRCEEAVDRIKHYKDKRASPEAEKWSNEKKIRNMDKLYNAVSEKVRIEDRINKVIKQNIDYQRNKIGLQGEWQKIKEFDFIGNAKDSNHAEFAEMVNKSSFKTTKIERIQNLIAEYKKQCDEFNALTPKNSISSSSPQIELVSNQDGYNIDGNEPLNPVTGESTNAKTNDVIAKAVGGFPLSSQINDRINKASDIKFEDLKGELNKVETEELDEVLNIFKKDFSKFQAMTFGSKDSGLYDVDVDVDIDVDSDEDDWE